MLQKDSPEQPKIVLKTLSLHRDTYGAGPGFLTGTAVFGTPGSYQDGIELKIKLGPMHIAAIVTACGDAIRDEAQRQAQGFFETSAEMAASLTKQLAVRPGHED